MAEYYVWTKIMNQIKIKKVSELNFEIYAMGMVHFTNKKQSKMSIFVLVCILYIYEVQVVKLTSVIE